MKFPYWIVLLGASLALAQTPDFSGVWKANADKSKGLPPQSTLMVLIDQKDGRLNQTNGLTTQRGEQRVAYRWDLSGKEGRGTLGGLPLKSTAKLDGSTLVVSVTQPNKQSSTFKYSLSADGNTLTIDSVETTPRGERPMTAVLEKQPAEAGAALSAPEVTA
jgi:hypothetical protein